MTKNRRSATPINALPRTLRSGRDMGTPTASLNEANLHSEVSTPRRSRGRPRLPRHSQGSVRLSGEINHAESRQLRQPQSTASANVRRHSIFTPPLLGERESTTMHSPSLQSLEGPSHVVEPILSNSQLIHHDGFGTRVDGLGTPSMAQESETSHAASEYLSMPRIGGLSTMHISVAPGGVVAPTFDHGRNVCMSGGQARGNGECNRELAETPPRPRNMEGTFGVRKRLKGQNISERQQQSSSTDDDDSSAIAATPGQGGPGAEMMNVYLGVGRERQSNVRGANPTGQAVWVGGIQPSSNDDSPSELGYRRAHASPSGESTEGCHENEGGSIQRNARRPQSTNPRRRQRSQESDGDGGGSMVRRSRRSQQVNEGTRERNSRENRIPGNVDVVEPNDRGDAGALDAEQSSRNRSIFSYSKRMADLAGDERVARSSYERMRKREWRAKKKAMTGEHSRATVGRGSFSFVARPQLQLFEGMPYSRSHTTLVRELSKIVRSELKSFRYVDSTRENHVTKEEMLKIHNLLGEKYENGKDLGFHWTKLHLSSCLRNWRTTQRGIVSDYLSTLPPNSENPPPPPGISAEEMIVYSRQLANEDYKQTSETMSKMATSMVEKRGCANPLGSGGVQRANAHYIVHKGKVPSIDEINAWKSEAYETYNRRRSDSSNVDVERVLATQDPLLNNAMGVEEDMGPDWNHPFNGPKAFFDRYVLIRGQNPTDGEISSWLSNGRPPLHA